MHDVVWVIRFPRVVLAIAIGMSLSISGVVMQAIVKIHWQTLYSRNIIRGIAWGNICYNAWIWSNPRR
ncbi:MAG: iron chelate uptake ABC transporter family permease subunit [Intestinibacter bartlettii]